MLCYLGSSCLNKTYFHLSQTWLPSATDMVPSSAFRNPHPSYGKLTAIQIFPDHAKPPSICRRQAVIYHYLHFSPVDLSPDPWSILLENNFLS
jgi:hypothetical protein